MIEGFDIQNFGSFKNFQWNSVRDQGNNVVFFKKQNLFYGRNCSGKTTLSRILGALETGELPEKYLAPSFTVWTAQGALTQADIPSAQYSIRVYNRDFVEKNLGFLRHHDGTIEPFAIIGSENKELEAQIAAKVQLLGSADEKSGLLHAQAEKIAASMAAERVATNAEQALDAALIKKATHAPNGMKHITKFGDVNYNKVKLRADIQNIKANSTQALSDSAKKEAEALISEGALPVVSGRLEFTGSLSSLYESAKELLARKIQPTEPIQELLNDAVLQAWVKEGISHHRNKRPTCGFCRQPLPSDLWRRLDTHFNKESTDLESAITAKLEAVFQEKQALASMWRPDPKAVYAVFRESLSTLTSSLDAEVASYTESLLGIESCLRARLANIFEPQPAPAITDNSTAVGDKILAINDLIVASNNKASSLEAEKRAAMQSLRLSEVATFVADIGFDGSEQNNVKLRGEANQAKVAATEVGDRVRRAEAEIQELRAQQKDEKKGASRINDFLNKHFGHQGLRLEAVEDEQAAKFRFHVLRGTESAHNLSEGECSLVAFCYFLAKLEDVGSYGKKLIVWIDDPISSLDSNHVFFVFSLIESQLARPIKDATGQDTYRYEQLFISTHNLEFLKYMRRLRGAGKGTRQHYFVAQKDAGSVVEIMPPYLKQYSTEFNYLFGEICMCADPANAGAAHHCFYSFGNNLRRFLEAYLFFKYPFTDGASDDYDRRVARFFGGDVGSETLVQRLTNEYSHLNDMFDRSVQPIDLNEISGVARLVLTRFKVKDPEQYKCLLESIGKPDPI